VGSAGLPAPLARSSPEPRCHAGDGLLGDQLGGGVIERDVHGGRVSIQWRGYPGPASRSSQGAGAELLRRLRCEAKAAEGCRVRVGIAFRYVRAASGRAAAAPGAGIPRLHLHGQVDEPEHLS
jgi:hypothetical protein